jgi:uncharacterized protein (TIGR03437 family)
MALTVSAVFWSGAWAQPYTISTVAGNGTLGFSGDFAAATAANLNAPVGVALDSSRNLYIVDAGNIRVREVSGGTITTVIGNGGIGYAGDGGAAIGAEMDSPTRVTLDSAGNIYVADSGNDVIRMVDTQGNISTVAGYVCPEGTITPTNCGPGYSGDGASAIAAQLDNPVGVAVDSAFNLYIADQDNSVVREVSAGTIVTLPLLVRLNRPVDLAVDSARNLYIADFNNDRIVKVTAAGATSIFAGMTGISGFGGDGGAASKATLSFPAGIAVDGAGRVYIADTDNQVIRMVDNSGTITTIAGSPGRSGYVGDGGPATFAGLNNPRGLAVDRSGNVYIGDTANNVVRMLQPPNPAINASGVVNAASYTSQISPGALATVFGSFLTATIAEASVLPLSNNMSGVQVTVNGRPAPVLYISPIQVNFQVPWETEPGPATVVVTRDGIASSSMTVPVLSAGPGLFTLASGAAIVQNYPGLSLNGPSNPAAAGSVIIAYLTGSGPLNGSVADGAATPASPLLQSTATVTATIGPAPAQVQFLGLTPGDVGLVQANIVVPSGLASGTYPLTVTVAGQASNSGTISVK